MRIAVIGAGSVGGTLGTRWAAAGHEVVFGLRDPQSPKVLDLLSTSCNARAASIASAAAGSDVVVLATPWAAARAAIQSAGNLAGKVLLDCTNPLKPDLTLDAGPTASGGEMVAGWAIGPRVVKIFNTTGFGNMANPHYGDQAATMFYAGDDSEAKQIAARLATDLGFEAVDAGPLKNARLLEPLAALWIDLAMVRGHGRDIAFKLLRR